MRPAVEQHPLPWSASRAPSNDSGWMMGLAGEESPVTVWDVTDAAGRHVATVVEPPEADPGIERPPPHPHARRPHRPAGAAQNLTVHWCVERGRTDYADAAGRGYVGCVCSTSVDHWDNELDRPELAEPKVITGAAAVAAVAADLHEMRERQHRSYSIAEDHACVLVNLPGIGLRTFGAVPPGHIPSEHLYPRRTEVNGRRDLALVRAMLADAWRMVDEDYQRLVRGVEGPTTEAVALAAQHLDAELSGGHDLDPRQLSESTRSALRTVLQAVSPP